MSTILDQIATRIIKEQELIIGPIAWQEAEKVQGLTLVDRDTAEIAASNSDPKEVVNQLVGRYERLFGRASREACRDAVASILAELSPGDVPSSLVAA
ncbi:MAG: hypothetical protein JWN49_307 [Parcubacteria group bacterium]|nr:hypothetical protein [Parcubacteria group bacterium]